LTEHTPELPTFREIAQHRISDAGPRDKTINIKVAIGTARMMVESEAAKESAMVAALENMLGMFDTPVVRRRFNSEYHLEACASARAALGRG
jgi:hypothetical protein